MNPAPVEPPVQKWTWTRWVAAVAVVFALHVILIFVFGARKPIVPAPVKNAPALALIGESGGDWNVLNNATLFALPDNNGFAGEMWAQVQVSSSFHSDVMPQEDPHWLAATNSVPVAGLGLAFNQFVQTNPFAVVHLDFNQPPQVTAPAVPTQPPLAQNSTLQVAGEIARRPLINSLKLPSWTNTDVIAPSKVQVLVDAAGEVVSATLLPPQNSLEPSATPDSAPGGADQYAVKIARTARFAPLSGDDEETQIGPLSRLTFGQLIFNWQTVPPQTAPSL
jgi:hypothetical protein